MAAVHSGIEHDRLASTRTDVAPPQIAVQPSRRLRWANSLGVAAKLVELARDVWHRALAARTFAEWAQSAFDIECRPVGRARVVLGKRREEIGMIEAGR